MTQANPERVQHKVSGQVGTVLSRGTWYMSVQFDGADHPSTVAISSVGPAPETKSGRDL